MFWDVKMRLYIYKGKNVSFEKIRKIFTAGLLLSVLHSNASFAVNGTFMTQTLSSNTVTSLMKVLSHFFPSLHGILEEILPKQSNDNQPLLNFIGVGKEGSASFSLSSFKGKYRNLQVLSQDLRAVLANSNLPILEQFSVARPSFERNYQRVNESFYQTEKPYYRSNVFYSSEGKKVSSSLHERRPIECIFKLSQEVKTGSTEGNQEEIKPHAPSHFQINISTKTHISPSIFDEIIEKTQERIVKFIEGKESNEKRNLDSEISQVPITERAGKEDEAFKSILLESKNVGSESSAFLLPKHKEAEDILLEANSLSGCSKGKAHLLPSLKTFTPKKLISKHARSRPTVQSTSAPEETAESIVGLSDQIKTIPPIPLVPTRLSQLQLKNDKLPQNHEKAITEALKKNKIKLSEKSTIILALQKLAKDSKLRISEIPELIEKLSQRVDDLIVRTYKITSENFEKHILQLNQPRYHVVTDIDFSKGFERFSQAVLELWRAKFLTDFIEQDEEDLQEKPLPTFKELSPFVNDVIRNLFDGEVDAKLNSQIKQRAKIVIDSSIKNGSLWMGESKFSTEDKKEIFAQVFKLLVLDSSFKIPMLTNLRGNPDIDSDKLKEIIKPYIILAVEQLYGSERAKGLTSGAAESENMLSQESITDKKILSAEEIVQIADPWLTAKLLELLPGQSEKEKIDFLMTIASQDKKLMELKAKIKSCTDESELTKLRKKEQKISHRTLENIEKVILEELGSQSFKGLPLNSTPALYRDVKHLIKSYLDTGFGFVGVIERTEPILRRSILDVKTSSELYHLIEGIVRKRKYKIQIRGSKEGPYVETSPLEVPRFIFLFSLPYWPTYRERLAKRKENDQHQQEKAQLKRKVLAEKLNEFFFDGKILGIAKPLQEVIKKEETCLSLKQGQKPIVPSEALVGAPPPPPPPPQKLSSTNHINTVIIGAKKDIQKSLRSLGLAVKEEGVILDLLLRYKLQYEHLKPSDIVDEFYKKFVAIFYQTLDVADRVQAHKKFASQLGIETSGQLVQKLMQTLEEELQRYFLESLTIENMISISTSRLQNQDSVRKFNTKFTEITTAFLKTHFQEALKQFQIDAESAGKNFEILEIFLKEELLRCHFKYTSEEKLEVVLGTFMRMLNAIEHNPYFNFPTKISEKDPSQMILEIEAFKPHVVEFLNEVIAEKFHKTRPLIKVPGYNEEIRIDSSKILPYLGNLFLKKAFEVLDGETQEVKINNLIDANPRQLHSLIKETLNSLLSTNYHYKTPTNTETTISFTEHTLKIFKEVIVERYIGFSDTLNGSCRSILTRSTDPLSLFSALVKNQLGITGNSPHKHKIMMSSPHDRKQKIESEETISVFDIFLCLPSLWQRKKELEVRKQRNTEEQQRKERETIRRVQVLRKFIDSDIEILSCS